MTPPGDDLTPEEQAVFQQSAARVQWAATRQLQASPGEVSVVGFVRSLQRGVDSVVASAVGRGAHLDCQAGCSHCCHARVEALAPEIFLIADALAARPAAERADTIARLVAHETLHANGVDPATAVTAWARRPGCPFLVDRLCSIYEIRPAACRKAHSTDVSACAASTPAIPQHLEIALHAEALQAGTAGAYRAQGLDAVGHELVGAVLLALRDPATAKTRWYRGEPVFG